MENLSQLNEQNIIVTNQQKCHICDKEFGQHELEAHFATTHELDDISSNQHKYMHIMWQIILWSNKFEEAHLHSS